MARRKKDPLFDRKETDIRAAIKQYLEIMGYRVVYFLQGLGCYPGISDLAALKNGKTYWIELKTPTGSQSEDQKKFQAIVESTGNVYLVARSLDEVIKWVEEGVI